MIDLDMLLENLELTIIAHNSPRPSSLASVPGLDFHYSLCPDPSTPLELFAYQACMHLEQGKRHMLA